MLLRMLRKNSFLELWQKVCYTSFVLFALKKQKNSGLSVNTEQVICVLALESIASLSLTHYEVLIYQQI